MAAWWRSVARRERARLLCAAAVALALVAGYEVQKHREATDPVSRVVPLAVTGPAADLTALQLGERPGPKSNLLRRLDSLLELLQADCPGNSRRRLAQYAVADIRELGRRGVDSTPNAVLGGVAGMVDIGATKDCLPFFRRFVREELARAG